VIFNSLIFVGFALVFYSWWPFAERLSLNGRWLTIVVGSFIFYGWWDWHYVILLIGTGMVDFVAGIGMASHPRWKRELLIMSVFTNLATLGFFKYSNFAATNLNVLASALGIGSRIPVFSLILPLGISFYTFQSLSYTIDIYRGQLRATRNPLHFFAAISLFPHLVAGPIMRASTLLPQLLEDRRPTKSQLWGGVRLIVHGYLKKMVIADNLAPIVNDAFGGRLASLSGADWWIVAVMFSFQIYCDFSGYSDIARGLAKALGYEFTQNFNHPYLATSLREFWTRWHISLSTWFRDYLYIPLGGSRNGELRSHVNMWITMLLSGLWHGAAWTFVIWGSIHAFFLSVERATKWPEHLQKITYGKYLALAFVMFQVVVAWVFFRATDTRQAYEILWKMFHWNDLTISLSRTGIIYLGLALAREIFCWREMSLRNWVHGRMRVITEMVWYALIITGCIFLRGPGATFIYFQF